MKSRKVLTTVFLATLGLCAIVSLIPANAVESSVFPLFESRERWWDERWHYRMVVEVDPNSYPRRWGNLIEFDAGLDIVSGLDINSIRVVRGGTEIPSDYDSITDTISMVLDKSMQVGDTIECTVYYDTVANGLKPVENPLAWVNDYLERWNELYGTPYQQGEVEQEFQQARDNFIAENSITYDTVNNIYTYQGYTVQWNPIDERWEFLNGTIVQFYFIEIDDGMGGFYYKYHDGVTLTNFAWHKVDGTWWYWNVQTAEYVTWEYIGQSIYMGATIEDNVGGVLDVGDADLGPDGAIELDLVHYVDDAWATWYDGSQWVMEDILVRLEREVPEVKAFLSTEQTVDVEAWGSAMFNLNGSIQLNDTFLTHLNMEEWLENEFGWVNNMTPIGGYVDEIEQEYSDDWQQLRDSAARIAIVSEQPAINIDDFDFDIDGYDMTGIYDTGNIDTQSLQVIPVLLDSKYLGLFDILTQQGFGVLFDEQAIYTNILIEAWKETLTDTSVNYYLNVSFNYLDWWYTSIQDDPVLLSLITTEGIHLSEDGIFNLALTLLDEVDPSVTMRDVLGKIGGPSTIPEEIVTEIRREESIPIEIGTIIVPRKATVGQEVEIVVAVKGETIGDVVYRIDPSPTDYYFDEEVDFFIINVPIAHHGKRYTGSHVFETIGDKTIRVVAFDTNGSYVDKTVSITISERAPVVFAWVASILSGIFGTFGIAVVKGKKSRNAANCLGGKCDL